MSRLSAGLLIGVAVLAGIYAVAATIASTTAGTFTTAEIASHQRMVEFAGESQYGVAASTTELANCTLRTGSANHCNNETMVAPRGSASSRASVARQPADAGGGLARAAVQVDVALYRAHRQLPY